MIRKHSHACVFDKLQFCAYPSDIADRVHWLDERMHERWRHNQVQQHKRNVRRKQRESRSKR